MFICSYIDLDDLMSISAIICNLRSFILLKFLYFSSVLSRYWLEQWFLEFVCLGSNGKCWWQNCRISPIHIKHHLEFVTRLKISGKAGLTMLLHLVMKVGKLLQPTVIYIGNAEKTFIKKVPKNDMSDPKRLKKELPKIIKKMSPEERILFVGTSLTPWDILLKLQ